MNYINFFMTALFSMTVSAYAETQANNTFAVEKNLTDLEKSFDGQIGLYGIDTNSGQIIAHRADTPFPMQSTLKFMVAAALFKQSDQHPGLLHQTIRYTTADLTAWHPITGQHIATGMTLEALAEAAVTYSDNPAANLLIKKLGGPKAITDFAQTLGNASFHIEHYEGNLNSNPQINQDTVTPKDMAISIQKLLLGNGLTFIQQQKLQRWMQNNTTGSKRIRLGVPLGWTVADKTGSGDYGIANDIGIVWSYACKPIVLTIYTVRNQPTAKNREDIVAATTKTVLDALAKKDSCMQT